MSEYLNSLEKYLQQFIGRTCSSLFSEFNLNTSAKSKNHLLSQALVNRYEGKKLAEAKLKQYAINIKTIQLTNRGRPKEAMSFSPIDYCKISKEEWENSEFRSYLKNDFLIFSFKEYDNENVLDKVFQWNVPESDLEGEIKVVWKDTVNKIRNGDIIKYFDPRKTVTWFLSEKITNICHVRPHGSNGVDNKKLPVTDKLTGHNFGPKLSFWFNHEYLKRIVDSK